MEKDYFEEFINNKKEYNNTKRHNVNKKLDYIIAQTDVIFNILKDINDNQIKAEFININQVKPPDFNNPMMLLNADNTDIQGDNNITWKVKNELESYALDLNYVGCKIIIDLCNIAPINGITEEMLEGKKPLNQDEVNEIIKTFNLDNKIILTYGEIDEKFIKNYFKRHHIDGYNRLNFFNIKHKILTRTDRFFENTNKTNAMRYKRYTRRLRDD